jgi:Spy/CpxP family protein refolding chaperone
MKKVTLTILLVFASAISLVIAQTQPPRPDPAMRAQHRVKMLTTLLTLTVVQQQQATSIFTEAGNAETALHDQLRTAHQNLRAAIKSNNASTIDQIASTIGNLTGQMTSIQAKSQMAFYQILTPDQQQKLAEFESERHGPHGPGGPGPSGN